MCTTREGALDVVAGDGDSGGSGLSPGGVLGRAFAGMGMSHTVQEEADGAVRHLAKGLGEGGNCPVGQVTPEEARLHA